MRVLNESKQICFNGLLVVFFAGAFATQAIASENDFPKLFNTEPLDDAGLMPAEQAARSIQLPSGFQASLFASEPDIQNPIAMTWDSAGRLWIAENYTYAERKQRFQLNLRDRVIVLDGTTKGRLTSDSIHRSSADAYGNRSRSRRCLADVPTAIAIHSRSQS